MKENEVLFKKRMEERFLKKKLCAKGADANEIILHSKNCKKQIGLDSQDWCVSILTGKADAE